jgi:hypothetical protein
VTHTYRLHGLLVCTEVAIDASVVSEGTPDVQIRWGARRPIQDAPPAGRQLAVIEHPARSWMTVSEGGAYTIRTSDLCDFELDPELREVTVHLRPDAREELASVLLGGMLASLLVLRGHCVLHASAVQTEHGVVAFVGDSGAGKTTVAALCCAAGARLVSDDALRVEREDNAGWCFAGSLELRLRAQAAPLAGALGAAAQRSTVDQRIAVAPTPAGQGRLALAAIVAPLPDHGGSRIELRRQHGIEAVMELVRHPRTVGWIGTGAVQRDFEVLAGLAAVVPVYRARLPWGPPFAPDWGERLLDGLATR